MNINKCKNCSKVVATPYSVTDIIQNKVITYNLCENCGNKLLSNTDSKKQQFNLPKVIKIKNAEELKNFLVTKKQIVCSRCGMTEAEFDKYGRMGCPDCYEHFNEKLKKLVFPYHNADKHVGKIPKFKTLNNPTEKLKLLKLQYAKALELEEYEKLNDIQKQIDNLNL